MDRLEGMKSYNKGKMILQFLEMQNEVMVIMSYWIIDKYKDIKDSGQLRINLEYLNSNFRLMNIDEEMVFNL